jgi:hypothetical protein
MHDAFGVYEFKADDDARDNELYVPLDFLLTRLFLGQYLRLLQVRAQVSTGHQFQHEVEVFDVLKGHLHVDDKTMGNRGLYGFRSSASSLRSFITASTERFAMILPLSSCFMAKHFCALKSCAMYTYH